MNTAIIENVKGNMKGEDLESRHHTFLINWLVFPRRLVVLRLRMLISMSEGDPRARFGLLISFLGGLVFFPFVLQLRVLISMPVGEPSAHFVELISFLGGLISFPYAAPHAGPNIVQP